MITIHINVVDLENHVLRKFPGHAGEIKWKLNASTVTPYENILKVYTLLQDLNYGENSSKKRNKKHYSTSKNQRLAAVVV